MPDLSLAPRARADLKENGIYTQNTWGTAQRNIYLRQIRETAEKMRNGSVRGRPRPDIRPGLLCFPCNRHIIFFRRTTSGDVEILRILHERMDFDRHL